jgi:hypothetical protein
MSDDTIATMTQNKTMTEFGDNDVEDWLRLVNSPPMIIDEHPVKETSAPSEPVHKVQRTEHNQFDEERPDERKNPNSKSPYQDNEILIKVFGAWKVLHRLYKNYKGGGEPFEKFDTECGKNVSVKMTTEEKAIIRTSLNLEESPKGKVVNWHTFRTVSREEVENNPRTPPPIPLIPFDSIMNMIGRDGPEEIKDVSSEKGLVIRTCEHCLRQER